MADTAIVDAIKQELERQKSDEGLTQFHEYADDIGDYWVEGFIDLTALAAAVEKAMKP